MNNQVSTVFQKRHKNIHVSTTRRPCQKLVIKFAYCACSKK